MIDQERLLELTQSYLKSVVSTVIGTDAGRADFDVLAPFGELGVDSFRVLKIIKALEADFGTLPKTLLFENFNIGDLAQYFVSKHSQALQVRFTRELPTEAKPRPVREISSTSKPSTPPVNANILAHSTPILLPEKEAFAHPELQQALREIFEQYKNEGSVSRGTRNIAPNLFIGSRRKGFFNYSRSGKIILGYAYTGPREDFDEVAAELYAHCAARNLELNILAEHELGTIGGSEFSSTPFGALQRILNLRSFTLDGAAMRRLRYQVSRFEKAGNCDTAEYRCGTDPEVDRDIAAIIDQWCAARTMVNPLIHIVKEEILTGTLHPDHRIFLTRLDDVLQNVILISPLSRRQNGYLMDLEFYPRTMPLGGLEFAIVRMIEKLVAEGCDVLSLGGTYGCKLEAGASADPAVDKILDDLRMQNIFNDEGNLQFKNKFRPENKTIYLCRPVGKCTPDNVIDIIMSIADPARMQTSDAENQGLPSQPAHADVVAPDAQAHGRWVMLSEAGFNPLNLDHSQVELDLSTDSWAQLRMSAIDSRMQQLRAQLQQPADLQQSLQAIFPFVHFALTTSGRAAEGVFYRAWSRKGNVAQNLLFPTTIFHQIDNGFTPRELPSPAVFQLQSQELFKGNLDFPGLRAQLAEDPASIAMVCVELGDNASGGYPVALGHLRQLKELLAQHSIALVMDATRVLENARFILEHEPEHAEESVWDVTRAMLGLADAVVVSLAKDFCIKGGMIATNDAQLFGTLEQLILEEGCGLDVVDRRLVALSMQHRKYIELQTLRRKEAVLRIWAALKEQGVPIAEPAGGHCVLVDVKQLPQFKSFQHPVSSFLAWMYMHTGIRAGAHSAGMSKGSPLNDVVRLAIPVGLKPEQVKEITVRLRALFAHTADVPELEPERTGAMSNPQAKYQLVRLHNVSGRFEPPTRSSDPRISESPSVASHSVSRDPAPVARGKDIAIIGMAGRYPKARNLEQLWENITQGADCIEDIPEARLEQRLHNRFTRRYRGGFIEGIDEFDAPFFNISPREARVLDPQERLFLEVACEALEDAGYYPETLGGSAGDRDIGVFVGAVWSMYQMLGVEEKIAGNDINPSSFFWSIANRVSYWMNLTGPSLTLDTACSASLTALHLACEAIHSGECSAAIVGGVNLDLHQNKFDINAAGGSLSSDGVCRSFGKGANGYVSGEGVGALLIKPLERAIADGDNIHGVIKSTAVTHSGRTSGYMIPGPNPQTRLVLKALERAGVDARSIGYIEAHGTGTELGDSIEIAALTRAFEQFGAQKQQCSIGSIKTNIGHLEAASGIVGVQKILLQMKHRQLVPSLHSRELNQGIDFANSPFYVQQALADWQAKELDGVRVPRRAGISAIGAGGTSAHIILEEHEAATTRGQDQSPSADLIFPISARSEEQLHEAATRLRDFLTKSESLRERDIAHTLQLGRKSFDWRLAVIARTREELIEKLTGFLAREQHEDVMRGHVSNAAAVSNVLTGREKQDFIDLLVRSGDPRRLARLWSDGVIPGWRGLMAEAGRKISLPTYPFTRERHWIANRKPLQLLTSASPTVIEPTAASTKEEAAPAKNAWEYRFSSGDADRATIDKPLALGVAEKATLFVRQLFANHLPVAPDEVDEDWQLMDTGITSLDMANMTQSLKEHLDPEFSPIVFFECTTVRSLGALLAQKYAKVFEGMSVTRQTLEQRATPARLARKAAPAQSAPAQLALGIPARPLHVQDAESPLSLPDLTGLPQAYRDGTRCVLLTGVTGFLGIHVLSELLSSDPEARAYCLVRASSRDHGLQRILEQADAYELRIDTQRITVMCGDINEASLGLSAEDWQASCRDVQQIIHASAHVNHIEGYATFRDSTRGMKEIIRLACTHSVKLIQFISSIAGCALKIGDEFSIYDKEDFLDQGEAVHGGYGQSKWVQEKYLQRAHASGVPFVIYRFGELSGSGRTGRGQTDDMVHRLLQMRLAVECRQKIANDVLDMLPVDFVSQLIVGTGKTPALWNTIMHATHLKPYSLANLYRKASSVDLRFEAVTRARFVARCYDFVRFIYSIDPVNGFVLECVLRDAEGSVRHRKMMDGYFSVIFPFAQDNFKRALHTLDLALPDWNALLDRYFEFWKREDCGFMARIREYQQWSRSNKTQRNAKATANGTEEVMMLENVGAG